MKGPSKKVVKDAQRIVALRSVDELKLTNIARIIAREALLRQGFYTCTIGDVKTLFMLEGGR
jgi:hypothetical protein